MKIIQLLCKDTTDPNYTQYGWHDPAKGAINLQDYCSLPRIQIAQILQDMKNGTSYWTVGIDGYTAEVEEVGEPPFIRSLRDDSLKDNLANLPECCP